MKGYIQTIYINTNSRNVKGTQALNALRSVFYLKMDEPVRKPKATASLHYISPYSVNQVLSKLYDSKI